MNYHLTRSVNILKTVCHKYFIIVDFTAAARLTRQISFALPTLAIHIFIIYEFYIFVRFIVAFGHYRWKSLKIRQKIKGVLANIGRVHKCTSLGELPSHAKREHT